MGSFLGDGASYERPVKVLCQVRLKDFGTFYDLHNESIEVQKRMVALCSSEVKNYLFSFAMFRDKFSALYQAFGVIPSVCWLTVLADKTHHSHLLSYYSHIRLQVKR